MPRLLKNLATLAALILGVYWVSLAAAYGFWIGVYTVGTVAGARAAHAAGALLLLPAKLAVRQVDAIVGTATPVPYPETLATLNAGILGVGIYVFIRVRQHRRFEGSATVQPSKPAQAVNA